jgi:glutamate racemase
MKGDKKPIGIFDSGLGGLTVYRALRRLLPGENVIYFGDTARVPYGTKSREAVVSFSEEISRYLLGRGVKFLVVACNTASSLALREIRRGSPVPVLGVIEPGVAAAVQGLPLGGRVLVTGTSATVASGAYGAALRAVRPDARVLEKACPLFVPLAEEGWCSRPVAALVAREYLARYREKDIYSVILGCTHYPLLKGAIGRALGGKARVVDSAQAAAQAVRRSLEEGGLLNHGCRGWARFVVSDAPEKFSGLARRLLGIDTGPVEVHRF